MSHRAKSEFSVSVPRETWIDTLRGLAILIMIPANMAPMLEQPHPLLLRLISSLAAPIFVILSGMMVALTARKHRLGYFIQRGLILILCGAFVDMTAWGALPFIDVDILYLIGLSLPLVCLANRLSFRQIAYLSLCIFILTPLLQFGLGYSAFVPSYDLTGEPTTDPALVTTGFLTHYLVDGYFPLFPWSGLMLLGLLLARLHYSPDAAQAERWRRSGAWISGGLLSIAGAILWWAWPGQMLERDDYCEMFYNPTLGFIATSVGITLLLYWVANRPMPPWRLLPLSVLGQSSLFIYMFHLIWIGQVYESGFNFSDVTPLVFIGLTLGLLGAVYLAAFALRASRAGRTPLPSLIKIIIGG